MKLNIISDLRKPGLVPRQKLVSSLKYLFRYGENLTLHYGKQNEKPTYAIPEVVLAVWQYVVEEEPVLQGMAKYGEGVVCILGVPVVNGQAN